MMDHLGSKPAPEPLRLIQAFMNTQELETGRDDLKSREGLADWMRSHELVPRGARLDDAGVRRTAQVRDALRELLFANATGEEAGSHAYAILNREAREAQLSTEFGPGKARIVARAPGIDGALGTIIARVYEAMADGSWPRLKACRATDCRWVFYDQSKNQLGAWCNMKVCGNREKVRAFRNRQKV